MKKSILLLAGVIICFSACTKQDRENILIDQEKNIDTYITGLRGEYPVIRNSGSNRIVITQGAGEEIVPGDSVVFRYAGYIFSNGKGTLFATNNLDMEEELGFEINGEAERKLVGAPGLLEGLNNGFVGAKEGEVCHILFSAKYGYGNTVVYNVPKLSPLFFEIWIDRVIKN